MLPALVSLECRDILIYRLSRDFTLLVGQTYHLVSRSLDSSRLMYGDMACLSCQDTLIGAEQGANHCGVGLCSSHQEVNLAIGRITRLENLLACRSTILITAVARAFEHIGLEQSLQDSRVHTLHIIAIEMLHNYI